MAIRSYQNKMPVLGKDVFVDETAIVIGDVELGEHCSVWPYAVIRGDVHKIRIGKNTNVQDGSILHVSHVSSEHHLEGNALEIGEDVTIGHRVLLHGCTIGDRVLIGMGSIVLDGAEVGHDVIIGAGSVVPPRKKLNSGYLYFGNPIKQIRPLIESEKELLKHGNEHYVKVKDVYLAAESSN